ncbi:MAG: vWA domain-containing protein [Bacillota bacterium]
MSLTGTALTKRRRRRALAAAVVLLVLSTLLWTGCSGEVPDDFTPGETVISVILLMDTTGSMTESWAGGVKMDSARQAAHRLLDVLEEEAGVVGRRYRVAVIGFNTSAWVAQEFTSDFALLRQAVDGLDPDGQTDIGRGLETALGYLRDSVFHRAYVILLSDGMANAGRSSGEILEWLRGVLHGEKLVASVYGANYGLFDINTRGVASFVGDALSGRGYETSVLLNRGRPVVLSRLPADNVFWFSGHANWCVMGFADETHVLSGDVRKLDLPDLLLAVVQGCLAGKNVEDEGNILHTFVDSGARVAIGYSVLTYVPQIDAWARAFWPAVEAGQTIRAASLAGTVHAYHEDPYTPLPASVVVTYPAAVAQRMTLRDLEEQASRGFRIYTVGFGDKGNLDENLLREIARLSGGEYLYGGEAQALENIFVKAQHLGTGDLQGEFSGTVKPGETLTAGVVAVLEGDADLRVTLNWPGSTVGLRLYDPKGRLVGPDYPRLAIYRQARPTYVVIERPIPGPWRVEVVGQDVAPSGTPFYVVASTSDVPIRGPEPVEFLLWVAIMAFVALAVAPRVRLDRPYYEEVRTR